MGTDEDAVGADTDSAPVSRANGDGSPVAGGLASSQSTDSELPGPDGPVPEPAGEVPEAGADLLLAGSGAEPDRAVVEDEPTGLDELSEPTDLGEFADLDELGEPGELDELSELDESDSEFDPLATPDDMSQMLFVDVVLLLPATHPVVVLQEADAPFRELRIPVGGAEGIAISYAARGLATPRPLTHELFINVLEEFGMTLDVVRITDVSGTSFTAEMVISGRLGTRLIDCRPSDAIALALRHQMPVPIMASGMVLAMAGTDPMGAN